MGSPKPLLEFAGETFLDRLIGLFATRCAPVIAVLGSRAEEIRAACRRASQADFVVNPGWPLGMLSSLQTGLRSLPRQINGFAFSPVDSPRIGFATFSLLVDRFETERPLLAIPRFAGRRGHPVICSRALIPEFLALPPEAQARQIIHRHIESASYVDVDDPAIIEDIDDPEAYRRLTEPLEKQ